METPSPGSDASTPSPSPTARTPVAMTTAEREYMDGLQLLRDRIEDVRAELRRVEQECPAYVSERGWAESEYTFNTCLQFLADKNLRLSQLDSEACMLSLINDLRATGADKPLVEYTTRYWENFHDAVGRLRQTADKFEAQVLSKLLVMFNNQILGPTSDFVLAREYSREITEKITSLEKLFRRLSSLSASTQTRVEREHMEKGADNSLTIVTLPRDLFRKLTRLLCLSLDVINREEKFMEEMSLVMAECRQRKREYEVELTKKREVQVDKVNSVNLATSLLERNKELLDNLDSELEGLRTNLANKENDLNLIALEMERDRNAIEFLSHTISTTKRNQRLLAKRQALVRTGQALEQKITKIKSDLQSVAYALADKVKEKEEMTSCLDEQRHTYDTVKQDLDSFMATVYEDEKEIEEVHAKLIDAEILHCIKTSPENMDGFKDRPPSVRIAQSLREKITNRRYRKRTS